jgi:tripartite-type tricarboxylate transporter receptor subunit TctC
LNAEITRILRTPEMRERMLDIGLEVDPSTSVHFAELVKTEIAKWAQVIKATGLRPE